MHYKTYIPLSINHVRWKALGVNYCENSKYFGGLAALRLMVSNSTVLSDLFSLPPIFNGFVFCGIALSNVAFSQLEDLCFEINLAKGNIMSI